MAEKTDGDKVDINKTQDKKKKNDFTPAWLLLGAVVVALIVIGFISSRPDSSHRTLGGVPLPEGISTAADGTEIARSCRAWEQKYAVINHRDFVSDTLRIGAGEDWLIRLQPEEQTGWIRITGSHETSPVSPVGMIYSDGKRITDYPHISSGRPTNTFWLQEILQKENCVLIYY